MRRNQLPRQKRNVSRMNEEMLKWIILAMVGIIVVALSVLLFTYD